MEEEYPAPSSFSSASAEATSTVGWKVRRACAVPEAVGKLVSAVLTCIFAIVGSSVGAMAGALIGLATENGLLRGAGIGAISGAVFSVEVAESSLTLLRFNGSGIWSVLFLMDTVLCLFSGRLVHEKIGPAVQSAVQSQMNVTDTPFQDVLDIFEAGDTRGMSRESLDKIPEMTMSTGNNVDSSGEGICCSVCLQDFQVGEAVRSLPHCRHTFHLACIDGWLIRRSSCPLCRRDF